MVEARLMGVRLYYQQYIAGFEMILLSKLIRPQ